MNKYHLVELDTGRVIQPGEKLRILHKGGRRLGVLYSLHFKEVVKEIIWSGPKHYVKFFELEKFSFSLRRIDHNIKVIEVPDE